MTTPTPIAERIAGWMAVRGDSADADYRPDTTAATMKKRAGSG